MGAVGLVRHDLKIIGRSGERRRPLERALRGLDHVGQQQGASHRPHAAGVGREPGGHLVDAVGDITGDAALAGRGVNDGVDEVASWLSPNPGGVGPMTRALLLANVVEAAERSR